MEIELEIQNSYQRVDKFIVYNKITNNIKEETSE